jgi:hypothetical protein
MILTVGTLREAFRHLAAFRSLYEAEGTDVIGSGDRSLSLWDLEYLYDCSQRYLSDRQAQAVRWILVENLPERQVAALMGLAPECAVGCYATNGLVRLLAWMEHGQLARMKEMVSIPLKHRLRAVGNVDEPAPPTRGVTVLPVPKPEPELAPSLSLEDLLPLASLTDLKALPQEYPLSLLPEKWHNVVVNALNKGRYGMLSAMPDPGRSLVEAIRDGLPFSDMNIAMTDGDTTACRAS